MVGINFSIWDQLDEFQLLHAAMLWIEKNPELNYEIGAETDAVCKMFEAAVKNAEIEFRIVQSTIEPVIGIYQNRETYFLTRKSLVNFANTKNVKPLFLFSEKRRSIIPNVIESEDYISRDLKLLCEAAEKFWGLADKNEKDTHPTNQEVINWLQEQGCSEITAKQGATIIRPSWAASGRRPKI